MPRSALASYSRLHAKHGTRRRWATSGKALSVLIVSTLAFTVCFMVWMMFGVIGIPIKKTLGLNATEFGLLTATPVLTGSLIRVPLGIWTDKYGGRIVMAVLMAVTVPADLADELRHRVLALPGASACSSAWPAARSRSARPTCARWFPRNRQGFAMGVYGAGNSGAAVNKFVAPALVVAFGWTMVPQVYAAIMLGTLMLFWIFSSSDPAHLVPSHTKFSDQLKMLKDPKVLKYCQYYSIVFGGYVALSCGWCSTTSASSAWTSAPRRCWRPASRCPAACCARSAAGCRTSTARTASPGGCCG